LKNRAETAILKGFRIEAVTFDMLAFFLEKFTIAIFRVDKFGFGRYFQGRLDEIFGFGFWDIFCNLARL
jgi:hypothetical protein